MTGRSEEFHTPLCRISYPQSLFKPRGVNDAPAKYSCTLIFPKTTNRSVFDNAVKAAAHDAWGDDGVKALKNGVIRLPFFDGAGKEARNKTDGTINPGLGEDVWFIRPTATLDRPPLLRFKSETVPATPEEIYAGCHGKALLTAFAWEAKVSGRGVSFGISYFQRLKGGEVLGGGGPVDVGKYFEQVEDDGPAPEETTGGKGAKGLFGF